MTQTFIIIIIYYYVLLILFSVGMMEASDNPSSSFHDNDKDPLFLHGNLPAMVRILPTDLHQWMASRPLT